MTKPYLIPSSLSFFISIVYNIFSLYHKTHINMFLLNNSLHPKLRDKYVEPCHTLIFFCWNYKMSFVIDSLNNSQSCSTCCDATFWTLFITKTIIPRNVNTDIPHLFLFSYNECFLKHLICSAWKYKTFSACFCLR